jgi:hypothetical protein
LNFADPSGRYGKQAWKATIGNPRVQGGLTAAGGVGAMLGGAALLAVPEPTTLTKIGGAAAIGYGADLTAAGARQLWTGQSTQSFTARGVSGGLRGVGVPPSHANFAGSLTEIGAAALPITVLAKGAAVAKGGDILANTYRLASPNFRSEVLTHNRTVFDQTATTIIRQRSTQLFSEASGNPINGYYNQVNNTIVLGKGSNLGTLTEELIHATQRAEYGRRIPQNMIPLMEKQVDRKLKSLGFELIDL